MYVSGKWGTPCTLHLRFCIMQVPLTQSLAYCISMNSYLENYKLLNLYIEKRIKYLLQYLQIQLHKAFLTATFIQGMKLFNSNYWQK